MSALEWLAFGIGGVATIPTLILFFAYRNKRKRPGGGW